MEDVFDFGYFADDESFTSSDGCDWTEDGSSSDGQSIFQQFQRAKSSATIGKQGSYNLVQYLMDDPLKMLGLSREGLRKRCSRNESEISLENKIDSLLSKFKASKSTTRQYIRCINVFLIWLFKRQPEERKQEDMLLLDHNMGFLFLTQCQLGNIGRTGMEPPVSLLIDGQIDFEIQKSKTRFSLASGLNALSSLGDLYSNQQMFLGVSNFTIFRKIPLITQFEENLHAIEIAESNNNTKPQNTVVFGGGCPIEAKLAHSSHLLLQDGFVNIRNMTLT